ncbi:MAG: hypothetical protein HZA50_16155 [Planctomycetes bacterium]|nr:hypothetical protein [Planctomycetota bacterium]
MALTENDFSFAPPFGSDGAAIRAIGEDHFRVELGGAPGHPEWRNALQFTILRNARGRRLRLEVVFDYDRDKDQRYNSSFLSFSYDMFNWRPVFWTYGQSTDGWNNPHNLIFPEFREDRVFVGSQAPFVLETLENLLPRWIASPYVRSAELGRSVQGRPIHKLTIADFANLARRPRAHYFKNEHGTEGCARWRMAGIVDWLLSDQAADFRRNQICHLIILSNPDGPANGWLRVNADGLDQNRTFLAEGPDQAKQGVEQHVCQRDVGAVMNSDCPLDTFWSFHTWQGPGEVMVRAGKTLTDWTVLRNILLDLDEHGLFEPMHDFRPKFQMASMWNEGVHDRFGITTFLSEGGTTHFTKDQCTTAGRLLIQALAEYYRRRLPER